MRTQRLVSREHAENLRPQAPRGAPRSGSSKRQRPALRGASSLAGHQGHCAWRRGRLQGALAVPGGTRRAGCARPASAQCETDCPEAVICDRARHACLRLPCQPAHLRGRQAEEAVAGQRLRRAGQQQRCAAACGRGRRGLARRRDCWSAGGRGACRAWPFLGLSSCGRGGEDLIGRGRQGCGVRSAPRRRMLCGGRRIRCVMRPAGGRRAGAAYGAVRPVGLRAMRRAGEHCRGLRGAPRRAHAVLGALVSRRGGRGRRRGGVVLPQHPWCSHDG